MKKIKRVTPYIKYLVMILAAAGGIWLHSPAGFFVAGFCCCLLVMVGVGSRIVEQRERRWQKWLRDAVEN